MGSSPIATENPPYRRYNDRFRYRFTNYHTGLGASSPSRICFGNDFIAENSDAFRETIKARNVYVAWARKLTTTKPDDPNLQSIHQEVGSQNQEASGSSSSPRSKGRKAKRSVDSNGFAPLPPSSLLEKCALPVRPLHSRRQTIKKPNLILSPTFSLETGNKFSNLKDQEIAATSNDITVNNESPHH
ncbi:hypothetical protein TNCV_4413461 [Trichonephila clavipes]|nr:hypothetical protein TNCV_4413461 [Trichonephila clavipes]